MSVIRLMNESLSVFQNFLYCNGTGASAPIQGSNCNANNAGSALVDVINSHWYEPAGLGMPPESVIPQVSAYYQVLSTADQNKPLWSGEGSWGDDSKITDPDAQVAWVARYYLAGWTAGLKRMYWYGYDSPHYGTLWTSGTGMADSRTIMASTSTCEAGHLKTALKWSAGWSLRRIATDGPRPRG